MNDFNYYKEPSDEVFETIKKSALDLWRTYDNTYGYADEKVDRIKDLMNVRDNCCHIVGMFDQNNQNKLLRVLGNTDAGIWVADLLDNYKGI